jgi:cold shock protein
MDSVYRSAGPRETIASLRRGADRKKLRGLGRQGYDCMASGTVKWFDETKGYGFIRPSDGGKDVFVHITAVRSAGLQTLTEGQKVNFDLVSERGKTAAGNLSLA